MADYDGTTFRDRLHALAIGFILPKGPDVSGAIELACDLLGADLDTPATVEVAALHRGATLRDSEELLRSMLAEHGLEVSRPKGEVERFALLRRAFGFWGLPLHEFEGPFYSQIPSWDDQDVLSRQVVLLLDARDHETTPARRDAIEEQIRSAVRAAE